MVGDSFKKIIITSGEGIVHRDSHGIVTISLADFLLTYNAEHDILSTNEKNFTSWMQEKK